ncbi:transposase family protein [Georgenia sp. MJ206]
MITTRVHSRRRQRVRNIPVGGAVEVVWAKRRWFCDEPACARRTFAEATVQVPAVRALDRAVAPGPGLGGRRLWARRVGDCEGARGPVVAGPVGPDGRGPDAA